MTIQGITRLLKQHLIWFILFPILGAGAVYYFMRNEAKTYKTKATLYTGITSGYKLQSAEENFHVDYSAVENAFDNILTTLNSNQTLYNVGLDLLSRHLQLQKPAETQLSAQSFQALNQAIPASLRQSLVRGGDLAYTRQQLDTLARSETPNPVRKLLLQSDSYYSAEHIGKNLKATRRRASDMLDLEYEASDPAVAQQTLSLAITEMNTRYTALKRGETNPVVSYYEQKAQAAKRQLDNAEAKLRAFNVAHNILNIEDELKTRSATREALVTEYNNELMESRAAKAAMNALSQRLKQGGSLLSVNTALTDKQAELTEAESQLINARASGNAQATLDRYQARIDKAAAELKQIAQNYFAADNTPESVPKLKLVNEWLDNVLKFEEASARMDVAKKRLDEYQTESAAFTPLESEQRQLTRDMTVAEKEYLMLIQSLNQANTHRQDVSLDGALSILDAPNFPFSPQPSKRLLSTVIGGGVGLVIALLLAALRFWSDRRINSLEQAEQQLGNAVVATFPVVKKLAVKSATSRASVSMFEQLSNEININIEARARPGGRPPLIVLFSMRAKQGKTWFALRLGQLYAESGERIAYYYPRQSAADHKYEQEGIHFLPYELHPNFMHVREPEELILDDDVLATIHFDKVILELPALMGSPIPLHLVRQSAVSLMILAAHTVWGRRDKQLFDLFVKAARNPVLVVLNKVESGPTDTPTLGDIAQGLLRTKRYTESTIAVPETSPVSPKLLNKQPNES